MSCSVTAQASASNGLGPAQRAQPRRARARVGADERVEAEALVERPQVVVDAEREAHPRDPLLAQRPPAPPRAPRTTRACAGWAARDHDRLALDVDAAARAPRCGSAWSRPSPPWRGRRNGHGGRISARRSITGGTLRLPSAGGRPGDRPPRKLRFPARCSDGRRASDPRRRARCSPRASAPRCSPGASACRASCCSSRVGMALGSDGAGWIAFDDYELRAQAVGIVALALILFEGGLTRRLRRDPPGAAARRSALAIVGTLVTARDRRRWPRRWLFDLTLLEGMLLGSILASTDGAAVFAVLRGSTLRRRLARTLEGEAGFNDPVAVLLVLGFIDWIQEPDYGDRRHGRRCSSASSASAPRSGVAVGWLAVQALKRTRLASAGLYPVASLAIAALAFGGADVAPRLRLPRRLPRGPRARHGAQIPAKRDDRPPSTTGMGWLAQVVMFLALGLLVFPSDLGEVALEGTMLAIVVVLVARPVGVFLGDARRWASAWREQHRPRLGRPARRRAGGARDVPGDRRRPEQHRVLQRRVLRRARSRPWCRARRSSRSRKLLGVTTTEAALPRAARRRRRRAAARRGGGRVPRQERRRDRRRRACASSASPARRCSNILVRGDQAILPRGSTRDRGRRPAQRARPPGGVASSSRALLDRWRNGPLEVPKRRRPGAITTSTPAAHRPVARQGRRRRAARPHVGGIEVAEQLRTRRDGDRRRARGARRRPLRVLGPDLRPRRRRPRPAGRPRPPPPRRDRRRAGVVGARSSGRWRRRTRACVARARFAWQVGEPCARPPRQDRSCAAMWHETVASDT